MNLLTDCEKVDKPGGKVNNTRTLAALLCWVSFFQVADGQALDVNYDRLRRPDQAGFYHVPIGLCEDYPEETTTLDIIHKDMRLLRRTGIDLLRISFGWDGIEVEKDKYGWGFWDDFVRIAVEENGITLIPYICYTPKWNARGDTTNFWNQPPKDYHEFGEFVGDLVQRYKRWIKSWEIWNEPDIKAYWCGTAEEFATLLKVGAEAVRRADSTALVVCGGLAWDTEFLAALFRDYGISAYVDVVNIHNYFETWNSSPLETIIDYAQAVTEIIQRYGHGQSIWVAEVGYSTFRENGRVSAHYTAHYDYEHTPPYQAVHLFRTLTLLLATEKVSAIAWYEVKDLPPDGPVIGDVNNRHLGIAYADFKPKPAERALWFFNRLFTQEVRCIDGEIVVRRARDSDSEVHAFRRRDGSTIVVAWLRTHIPGRRTGGSGGTVKDRRKEIVEVIIPGKRATCATLYDELGRGRQLKSIACDSDSLVIRKLTLLGGKVVVLEIQPVPES